MVFTLINFQISAFQNLMPTYLYLIFIVVNNKELKIIGKIRIQLEFLSRGWSFEFFFTT